MYKTFYLDEVQHDILTAKQWYVEHQKELGARFTSAVKEALLDILKMPSAYAVRYRNVRITHVKIFPYNIHFYIDETKAQVVVIGVVHNNAIP